ncbi:hypothetical protein BC940DRAFT_292710 [Gongronella butleri]|nr:hypothetical protein BC940DRAFT_292710 [Gongronella butleri]
MITGEKKRKGAARTVLAQPRNNEEGFCDWHPAGKRDAHKRCRSVGQGNTQPFFPIHARASPRSEVAMCAANVHEQCGVQDGPKKWPSKLDGDREDEQRRGSNCQATGFGPFSLLFFFFLFCWHGGPCRVLHDKLTCVPGVNVSSKTTCSACH